MTRPPTTSFGTLTDSEQAVVPSAASEPPKAKEAPAPSLPPPPPESALRASASKAPPRPSTARPTTRGLAPPPPPRQEGTQQIDLEQIELMGEDAVQEELPTGGADQTMELSPDHFVAVESAPEKPSKERDDLTVPVRLDQILAIAPAKLRASVAPPAHPEPPRTAHTEPAPVDVRASAREQSKAVEARPASSAASSHDVTHPGVAKSSQPVAPQQTMFVEDGHEALPFPGADGQGGMPTPNFGALFGDLPAPNPSARFGQPEQEPDDSGAVQTIVAHRPGPHNPERPFDHIVPGDDDATTAMAGAAPDDSDERALRGRGISDSLRPFLHGPLRDPRKIAIGVAAAAAAGLLIFGVKAMVKDDAGDLAARAVANGEQSAAGAHVTPTPSVEPRPSVEPAPAVVALAATPKGMKEEAPAEKAREPETPASAAEIPPPSVTVETIKNEPAPSAEPVPAAKLPSASGAQAAPAAKPAKLSRAEKRRLQREERARAATAKAAEKQAQKSAKTEKSGGASGDRAAKATAARDEARDAYSAGNYKAAAQAYERAIQYDPSNVKLFAGLGMTRTKLHDLKGAAAAYERAVQLSPSSSVYYLSLGRLYAAIGDKNKAKAAYKKALALDPKNAAVASELKALGG